MVNDIFLPAGANPTAVLGTFIGFLIVLDFVLVRLFKLGELAWKKVDYVWLAFSALGLLSAIAQVRIDSASGQLDLADQRTQAALTEVRDQMTFLAQTPGAYCRNLVRTEFSPPVVEMDRMQREFDATCAWAKTAQQFIREHSAEILRSTDGAIRLPTRPRATLADLNESFTSLDEALSNFRKAVDARNTLRAETTKTSTEVVLEFLWPYLLAFALAIRITKVTGEIRLIRRK
jgi:hypothetical protein